MGCGTPVAAKTGAFFGQGSGPVWLEGLSCSGYEPTVRNCLSNAIGTSPCSHGQDAGVICRSVKLVEGPNPCDGRVQVLYNNHWGGVCHTGWGLEEAAVLCKARGCGDTGEPQSFVGPFLGPIWMDNLACKGNEVLLRDCLFTGYGVSSCADGLYAGVVCNSFVRRGVVRIVVTAESGFNVNDLNIMKNFMDKINNLVKIKGDYFVNWKTQSDGKVFKEIRTLQVLTECNRENA
ncbi:CD5 antigen-like [Misgurnus anguillicaudatus]|uniref:CD5 antigen-like n=1 Tax=Misgurnus anguillicaudatus TaxID=75329 RepID=UPI003CCF3041